MMCLLRVHQKVWNNDRVVWTAAPSYRARQNWASRDSVSLSDCHWRKCKRCEEGAEPLMCSWPEEGGINQHCRQSDHRLREEREGRDDRKRRGRWRSISPDRGRVVLLTTFSTLASYLITSVLPLFNHREDFKLFDTLAGMMTKWCASWIKAFKGFSAKQVKMFMTMAF